jgi:hypothetical protein
MREAQITPGEIKRLLFNVYKRYRSGRIDGERAKQETTVLTACLKAVEEDALNERLDEIRSVLREA